MNKSDAFAFSSYDRFFLAQLGYPGLEPETSPVK